MARSIASCTASSASCRCCEPSSPASQETILPACLRNRCSSRTGLPGSFISGLVLGWKIVFRDHFANLNRPEVCVRVVSRESDRFVEVRGFNGVEAAHHLSRLAEWSFGYGDAAVFLLHDAPCLVDQAGAADNKGLVPPSQISLGHLLHLF